MQPSAQPSGQPSAQPVMAPTSAPTSQPSSLPTASPSAQPSSAPTSIPTSTPTQPTSQPTSVPTCPTFAPTIRPTQNPSSKPSSQPSAQPSSQPTSPTGQPTSQPSFDPDYRPVLLDRYAATIKNLSYTCKPVHLHSTMNDPPFMCMYVYLTPFIPAGFQRIFFGMSLQSRVYADLVQVTISPYTRGQDQLSLLHSDYRHNIKGNFSKDTGVLQMIHEGGGDLTKDDWDNILNYPTYKLNINNFNPRSCSAFTKGKYAPTITMQM